MRDRGCLLLPATTLVDARTLAPLLADPPEAAGTVVTESMEAGAPVLILPAEAAHRVAAALATGEPLAATLMQFVEATRPKSASAASLCLSVRGAPDLAEAERLLYAGLGTDNDTGVDQYLHRHCSRWITRVLVRTPVTPNQVSILSLCIGLGAVWCFWHATAASAALGVLCYALACVVDHSDGEIARLTFQESRLGAHLDWAIDTVIHAGLVLAMAVSSGGGALTVVIGVVGASGVALSALFARYLPREIAVGETVGGVLNMETATCSTCCCSSSCSSGGDCPPRCRCSRWWWRSGHRPTGWPAWAGSAASVRRPLALPEPPDSPCPASSPRARGGPRCGRLPRPLRRARRHLRRGVPALVAPRHRALLPVRPHLDAGRRGLALRVPAARAAIRQLWSARLAGEAVNATTPTASVGGEPVKVYLLRCWVSPVEGLASVIVDKTTLVVGQGLFLIFGLTLARTVVPRRAPSSPR